MQHFLSELRVEAFRCISSAELQLDSEINLFTGGNGAGKTSLLEAIHVLGRGRSFRTAENRVLIASGSDVGRVSGTISAPPTTTRPMVRFARQETILSLDGRPTTAAELASVLPLQAVHADIGALVSGPPEARRRLLDWGVFHVKHGYLEAWQQFRRALHQRNAALREDANNGMLEIWDEELARAALTVHQCRLEYFGELESAFHQAAERLLAQPVNLRFHRGWSETLSLAQCLKADRSHDAAVGYTRAGPHRADLEIQVASESSRRRASKGQQKLLGAALILAQCDLVTKQGHRRVALVVDEPAADLDREHLARFLQTLLLADAQLFIAAISEDGLPLDRKHARFHVEHGRPKALL